MQSASASASASETQDPNENSLNVGYYLWLAAIGAIVYAYVFATSRSDMANKGLDPTKLDEATGKPQINTGNRVIALLPLVWLYTFLTKVYTSFAFEYAGNVWFTIFSVILTLVTLIGLVFVSIGATQSTNNGMAIEGSERTGWFTANVVFMGIIVVLFPLWSALRKVGGGNYMNVLSGLVAKASQFVFSFWFPFMMMYYFIKTGATNWFRMVATGSIVAAIAHNLYNLYNIYIQKVPLKDWMTTCVDSFKYFIETSPLTTYFKFVENNDLNDVAKRVLIFGLLCYVAYLMISVYKFKNSLVPCVSTHFASCFWNPNFKQSDGAKTYYDPEKNTPYINALFYTLMMSMGVNILNFIVHVLSLYKRYNNAFNGATDIIPDAASNFSAMTLIQMILFPFYWTFKLFAQHPLMTIVAFIAFAAIGLLLYRSSFDLTEFVEGQRGTVITLFTLFIASLIMFGVYSASNKGPSGATNKGSSAGRSSAGRSSAEPTYAQFLLQPLMFIAVAACIIGIISYFLTSQSRLVTMANLLQYAITLMIYITGIAIVIGLVRTMFSTSRKMGESMFQTSEDSNWVINVLKLIGNVLFYLPCLMLDTVDMLKEQYRLTTRPYLILLAVEAAFILAGLYLPMLVAKTINHMGVQIVAEPISMTTQTVVSKYQVQFVDSKGVVSYVSGPNPLPPLSTPAPNPTTAPTMNPTDIKLHNYSYGVSAWFYIHPQPPTTQPNSNTHINVFKIGNDGNIGPKVSYKSSDNTLSIEMHGSAAIPLIADVPLQRWNNVVINSDKGAVDIFMNGKLVYTGTHLQSANSAMHNVVIGNGSDKDETRGVQGEICNMVLNRDPFTNAEIAWFYATNKMMNPPVMGVNPDPLNQGDSARYLASQSVSNVIADNEATPDNPLSFSTHGAKTYGFLGAFLGAIFGWLFNRDDGVEPVKGVLMGTIVFGLIGALLGALFSTDGTVANIMKTVANIFVNTF